MKIRKIQPQDLDCVYECICSLEEERFTKQSFSKIFNDNISDKNKLYLLAEENESGIGLATCHFQQLLHHNGIVAEIKELFIEPAFRVKGIGKKLVETITSDAQSRNAVLIEVSSNLKRGAIHPFYQKLGFADSRKKFTFTL